MALESYLATLEENVSVLATVLTACASEMIAKFPDRLSIEKIVNGETAETWIWNRCNKELQRSERGTRLRPQAEKVMTEVREYLKVDELMKG